MQDWKFGRQPPDTPRRAIVPVWKVLFFPCEMKDTVRPEKSLAYFLTCSSVVYLQDKTCYTSAKRHQPVCGSLYIYFNMFFPFALHLCAVAFWRDGWRKCCAGTPIRRSGLTAIECRQAEIMLLLRHRVMAPQGQEASAVCCAAMASVSPNSRGWRALSLVTAVLLADTHPHYTHRWWLMNIQH